MVGSVSAASENTDNLQVANETDMVSTGEDAVISVSDSDDTLEDTTGNFSELQGLIDDTPTGGTLTLQKNFAYASGDSTGGITISKQIVINGNGKTIDGGLLSGYNTKMFIVSASDVVITHLNFKNARYCYQGPGIYINTNAHRTNITYCTFDNIDNRGNTNYNGGVIYILSSYSYVDHCNFTNSYCNNSGCLNYFSGAKYGTVTNSYFENCSCRANGGAIESYSDTGYFENLTFKNCSALGNGGAIVLLKGAPNTQIVNCHFYDCSANNGGGVYSSNPDCINTSYINCDFQGCSARTSGGAIYFNSANTTITLCSFSENSANSVGGAIYSNAANSTIDDCTFVDNVATDGSNYYASSTVNTIEIVNCDFDLLYVSNGGTGNGLTTQTATNWTYAYGKIGLGKRLVLVGTFTNLVNITIGKSVVIEGYNNAAIIDLGKHGRAFVISGNNVVVTGITFKNGQISDNGGAILWQGTNGNLTNCNFTDNNASASGGAIYWSNNAYIDKCTFKGNTATSSNGGAVTITGQNSKILNSVFKTSWSRYNGGAVHFTGANGLINNTEFISNYGGQEGGAIEFEGKNTVMSYCLVENNTAGRSGGGVWWGASTGNNTMFKCTINNNTSPNAAGGIGVDAVANTTINYCNITNNKANTNGGGIYSSTRTGNNNTIINSKLENNSANNGGGIYIQLNTTVTDCNFTNNTATTTGGAMYWGYNGGSISNVQFSNNNAPDGADIFLPSSNSNIEIDDNIKFDLMYVTNTGTGNGLKRDTPTNWTYAMSKIENNGRIVLIGDFSSWVVKNIDKSITIEGSSASLTAANNNGFFVVNANNVHIDNVELKNMVASTYAIVWNGEGGIISNSTFTNNRNSGKAANIKTTKSLSVLNNTFDVTVNFNTASLTVNYDNNFAVTGTLEGMDISNAYANVAVSVGGNVETTTQMKNSLSFNLAKRLPNTYTLSLASVDSNSNNYNYLDSSNTATLTVNRLNTIYIGPSATGSGNGTSTSNLATWDGIASRLSNTGTVVFVGSQFNNFNGKTVNQPWTLTALSKGSVVLNGGSNSIFTITTNGVKIVNLTLISTPRPIVSDTHVVSVENSTLQNQISVVPSKTSYIYGETISLTVDFGKISPSTITAKSGTNTIGTSTDSTYEITRNGNLAVGSYTLTHSKINFKEV